MNKATDPFARMEPKAQTTTQLKDTKFPERVALPYLSSILSDGIASVDP